MSAGEHIPSQERKWTLQKPEGLHEAKLSGKTTRPWKHRDNSPRLTHVWFPNKHNWTIQRWDGINLNLEGCQIIKQIININKYLLLDKGACINEEIHYTVCWGGKVMSLNPLYYRRDFLATILAC
jgi:hypothetical protein